MTAEEAGQRPPAPKPVRVPAKLSKAERGWAIVFGVPILGTGSVAVFVVDRDWGPVALIGIGAVLLLAGVVGRLPYVKWGDKELDYRTSLEQSLKVIDSPPEERSQKLEELAETVPPDLAPEVRKLLTAAEVMDLVRASLPRDVAISDGIGVGDQRSDGTLIDRTGRKVILEIRADDLRPLLEWFPGWLEHLKSLDTQIVGGLLVHVRPAPPRLRELLQEEGWQLARVSLSSDESEAMESLSAAFERLFPGTGH